MRYFANRIHSYDLNHLQKQKEINTVKQIILNNKYNTSILNKIGKNSKQRQNHEQKNQKMGQVHIHRKRNYIHYETLQKHISESSLHHQQ